MKILIPLVLLLSIATGLYARHGKGGSLTYQYLGVGSSMNTSRYSVVVQHFVNCDLLGNELGNIYLGVYDAGSSALIKTLSVFRTSTQEIQKTTFNSCINPVPVICFYVATYATVIELDNNSAGYVLTEQECCRAAVILNINNPTAVGFTYMNTIPGIINGVTYRNNSSPTLIMRDTAVICHNFPFTIDFGSTDADNDSLVYSFCSAYASESMVRQANPPLPPPYNSVPYSNGYSGSDPMGASNIKINSSTGLISGTAPSTTGMFVIAVCIAEFRKGVQISVTQKEVLVTVADCSLTAAALKPEYINCQNSTFTFENESTASNITTYAWDFGVKNASDDVSDLPTPTYTYKDTGTYQLKLKVGSSSGCSDSTTALVKVYPGFNPAFTVNGSCYQSPFLFSDSSFAAYGSINSWVWNFGDTSTSSILTIQNPSHTYDTSGNVTVSLSVTSTKGCSGIVTKNVVINNKPLIQMPFSDTLICKNDKLPIQVKSSGTIAIWSPGYNITNTSSFTTEVYPYDTTTYTITVKDKGCIDSATLKVNVLDRITVRLPTDTSFCKGDTTTLHPISDALGYTWQSSDNQISLLNHLSKNPLIHPSSTTTYYVTANLGHCLDSSKITVHVSPYPSVSAGPDTAICYGSTTRLAATTSAAYFSWNTNPFLFNTSSLSPTVSPPVTTSYIITATDTFYCPKPSSDTVLVTVIPRVNVFAGNDTSIVINQPLQLNAIVSTSNVSYTWSPPFGISNTQIANPIILISSDTEEPVTYFVRATTPQGCSGYDSMTVKVFTTLPEIFVPTAFTPNSDGKNDLIKATIAGIAHFNYLRIYNRWGQLLFSTSTPGEGWNGLSGGQEQPTGTYVYIAEGIDYKGGTVSRKGTILLIR